VPAPVAPAPAKAPAAAPVTPVEAPTDEAHASDEEEGEHHEKEEDDGTVYLAPGALDNATEEHKATFWDKWRNFGGSSLALSLAIHAGLLVLAGFIVFVTVIPEKPVDFLPGGGSAAGEKASSDVKQKVTNKRRTTLAKSTPKTKLVSTSTTAEIALPETPLESLDVPDMASSMAGGSLASGGFGKGGAGGGFGNGVGMGGAGGMVSLPPSMRARCSTSERLLKLKQNGGSPECEAAISRALEWFKTKQNKDGSWGTSSKAGMTGMALLCYLGRCETPDSPFYGENVTKGIMYLLELSKKNQYGYFVEDPKPISAAYEHGIATYALGEMYTLARLGSKSLPGMKEAFEKGVKLVMNAQNENGSWGYYTAKHVENGKPQSQTDLSVTGWQYQALKAAKNTGLKIAGLQPSIAKCVEYLESTQTKDGGFGNANRDAHYNQWSLTGAGALGLQTLGHGQKTKAIDKGLDFLTAFVQAEPLDWNKNCNLYCWYYYTQTFFQKGGDQWKVYNEMLLPQLLNNQTADGSWKTERSNWPAGAAGNREGGVYKTALCVLQLEVYYRYLKVADREESSFMDDK
jgi:hypothetical protein